MRRDRFVRWGVCLIVALGAVAGGAGEARGERQVRIRNDLTGGRLFRYQLDRTVRRTTLREGRAETLTFGQRSDWVRFHMDEAQPGNIKIAQMMIDHPARVLAVLHDGRGVEPRPSAASLGLSRGSARLTTEPMTYQDSPAQVPAVDAAQQGVLWGLVDFMHWPGPRKAEGDRWQREVRSEEFRGTQTLELAEMRRVAEGTDLVIRLELEGDFIGAAGKAGYRFDSGRAEIVWSSSGRMLRSLRGEAAYHRGEGEFARQVDLKLDVRLIERRVPDEAEARALWDQLVLFGRALDERRTGQVGEARRLCGEFRTRWPDGVWLPAVAHLERQFDERRRAPAVSDEGVLRRALGNCVARWQAGVANGDEKILRETRGKYRELAELQRDALVGLLRSGDENSRALAVFALAFGSSPSNLGLLEGAARDPSGRVRAWATYGLTVRGSAETDTGLLKALLADAEGDVRARACQAVAACVKAEAAEMETLRARIVEIVLRDRSDGARFHAAAALAEIGTAAELDVLRRALTHEVDRPMREQVKRAIAALERRTGGGR